MMFESICIAMLVLSVIGLFACLIPIDNDLKRAKKEISRFPLFEARGQLVQLVAEGKISEDEPAWQNIYSQVNFLLRMDQNLDALDMLSRFFQAQVAAERDPQLKKHLDSVFALERKSAKEVPEFGRAVAQTDRALAYLVYRRTTRWHRMTLLSLRLLISYQDSGRKLNHDRESEG